MGLSAQAGAGAEKSNRLEHGADRAAGSLRSQNSINDPLLEDSFTMAPCGAARLGHQRRRGLRMAGGVSNSSVQLLPPRRLLESRSDASAT